MSWSRVGGGAGDLAWRMGQVASFGLVQYLAENPPRILVATLLPRFALQVLFFTLLGSVAAGADHRSFAFIGVLAGVTAILCAVGVSDVPVADKYSGTFASIRTGVLNPFLVFVLRALPYPVVGFASAVMAMLIVAPIAGQVDVVIRLLPLLPLYLLVAFTTTAMGLAAAALTLGKRADVIAGNAVMYLILLAGGVFLPPGRLAWVDTLGTVIPVRHGLLAIHAALAGRPWGAYLAGELAVGAGWTIVAYLVVRMQVRRAARHGHDDFD